MSQGGSSGYFSPFQTLLERRCRRIGLVENCVDLSVLSVVQRCWWTVRSGGRQDVLALSNLRADLSGPVTPAVCGG